MPTRALSALVLLLAAATLCQAQLRVPRPDGANEVLVTVNGQPITWQQIVGDRDMQAEINALRQAQREFANVPDATLEGLIVARALPDTVFKMLLDAEADKLQLRINDSAMRFVIHRERKAARIADEDDVAWAKFVKARYGLTASEYRERRRTDIRRSETLAALAGARGTLPAGTPVEVYFSLSVTPRDVRREFERTSSRWKVSRNIDYEQFRLYYPQETPFDIAGKLHEGSIRDPEKSVYARAKQGESMEAASEGLRKLIQDLNYPGVRFEITPRRVAADNTELDADSYSMVLQTLAGGGLTPPSAQTFEDEDGGRFQVLTFIRVYSRVDGDLRNFEDVQVQEAIRNAMWQQRFSENQNKVQQALFRSAAIVPRHVVSR